MFKLKVGNAEQYQDIAQNETRLRVPFTIIRPIVDKEDKPVLDSNGHATFEVMDEHIESFPLGTSVKEVQETLQRHLNVFTQERKREAESRERQAKLDEAQEVAGEISNLVID